MTVRANAIIFTDRGGDGLIADVQRGPEDELFLVLDAQTANMDAEPSQTKLVLDGDDARALMNWLQEHFAQVVLS